MRVIVTDEAREEVQQSSLYFDALRPSKFDEFLAEWDRGLTAISSNPRWYPPDEDAPNDFEVRTYLFPRFQRRIIYWLRPDEITVLALAHTRRRPGYWLDRLY